MNQPAHPDRQDHRRVCGDHGLLQQYAEGTLNPAETRTLKEHLAACTACRSAVSDYKQIMWDLSHPPEVELPAELEGSYQTLMAEWRKEQASAKRARSRSFIPAWASQSVSWTRYLPTTQVLKALAVRVRDPQWPGSLLGRVLRRGGER